MEELAFVNKRFTNHNNPLTSDFNAIYVYGYNEGKLQFDHEGL